MSLLVRDVQLLLRLADGVEAPLGVPAQPSKSPLPGGFWVFLGSSRKGLAEIDTRGVVFVWMLCKYNSRLCVSVKTLGRPRNAARRGHRYEIAVVDEGS